MFSEIQSKIKRNYNEGGILKVFESGMKKISCSLYNGNNAYWYRMDLRNAVKEFPFDKKITVSINVPDETIPYIKEHGYYYQREVDVGLSASHIYSNIKHDGKIVGYNKAGFSTVYIEDFKKAYNFIEKVAFTYDICIERGYRNSGYGARLLAEVCRYLKQRGYISIWAHIPPWNAASAAMHRKLGFKKQKKISYHSVVGISWTSSDPLKLVHDTEKRIEEGKDRVLRV